MSSPNILVVEDDKNIAKLVKYNLEKAGYTCEISITGEDALSRLEETSFDLIILDIMLPKMDGLETCKRIKQDKILSLTPIIMLTAKGEEIDRIVGLELGSDDYMVKPFSPRELILRIKTILRRSSVSKKEEIEREVLTVEDVTIDTIKHRVSVADKEIKLTSMEFKLLWLLMKRKGRLQSRDQLLQDVWEMASDVTTRTIDTHIKRLRQKLGKKGKLIETIRGHGYRMSEVEG